MSAAQEIPSEQLVLAAIDRADRHRRRPAEGVSRWEVLEHLAVGRRAKAARVVKARLDALTDSDVLAREKRHGTFLWRLTATGRRRLEHAHPTVLPESPQHRRWREARDRAPSEARQGREQLSDALREARKLLDQEQAASSDAWFLASIRLAEACITLAGATYCLSEWEEPDDTKADIDERREPATAPATPEELSTLIDLRYKRRRPARQPEPR
jgi:hypothetical protein